ncbi:MAG TPA: NUMOD3 domain-containing DNA-binding protein [Methanosarcina sp.]|nr:NUMOD3 domain-containing DNA-binding protein [Methanosarcina sp.]
MLFIDNSFKPTYLCIKRHTVTGKLYFCKTTRSHEQMLKYLGSGHYWKRHINKHGKEFVETIWYCLYYDKNECEQFALAFSQQQNITESGEWANEKPENGLDGWAKGCKRGVSRLKGTKTGRKTAGMLGKVHSESTKQKMKESQANLNYTHSKETKDLIKLKRSTQVITAETKTKISMALKGRDPWNKGLTKGPAQKHKCPHCDVAMDKGNLAKHIKKNHH